MKTLEEVIAHTGVDVLDHLDRADPVPVLKGLQAQGDLLVIPATSQLTDGRSITDGAPVEAKGVEVIRGEAGANPHTLLAEGVVLFTRGGPHALSLVMFTVAEDATAYLAHPEHGYLGMAPGTYEVRRQRELAEAERRVAD